MTKMACNSFRSAAGRSTIEALMGFLTVLVLVPPIISTVLYLANSFLQAAVSMFVIAVPWLALIVLVAIGGVCLAALGTSWSRTRRPGVASVLPQIPPVHRPPDVPHRREDY